MQIIARSQPMSTDPRDPEVRDKYEPVFTPPTEADWQRLEATDAIWRLMDLYGAKRVARWVRNLAAIRGEEIRL